MSFLWNNTYCLSKKIIILHKGLNIKNLKDNSYNYLHGDLFATIFPGNNNYTVKNMQTSYNIEKIYRAKYCIFNENMLLTAVIKTISKEKNTQ